MSAPLMTLLIIDDNAGNLELLSSALRRPDIEILTTSDPEEGLDLVASATPRSSSPTSSCPASPAWRSSTASWRSTPPSTSSS